MSESQIQIRSKTEHKPVDEILLVDDSPTVLAVASKMLEERYVVVTAANGLEAWDILNQNKAITLVFSDMQMPIMNGLELLLKIRNSEDLRLSKLPVVMITGKSDTDAGKQAVFDIGASDFIGKPFDTLDLISRARAYVNPKNSHRKRVSDIALEEREIIASASSFHSVGCQALEFSRENDTSISVVYIELGNYEEIEEIVGNQNAKAVMLTVAKRINETVRDEDITTRLGVNKLAVMYSLVGSTSSTVVSRLINHLDDIEFEFEGKPIKVDILHGYENSKHHDKDVTFSEICMHADSNLHANNDDTDLVDIRKEARRFGESIFGEFKSRGKKLSLWFFLKSVISGDFEAIPKQYELELLTIMKRYIKFIEDRDKA
ncbi:MAG: response regulator [Gammaproteobacteria bacterium]|nr:response regulator [Gammaproteobacteria bacterium]